MRLFTGIIEELGSVEKLDLLKDSARLTIRAQNILAKTLIGDSIAVNGVCLTVTDLTGHSFSVDMMYETLRKTNLQELKQQAKVNLERALQLQTRLGGHLVSGHIDGTGKIGGIQKIGIASVCRIDASAEITSYIIPKGSIAVDGISLTVIEVQADYFTVSLIPHTFQNTTLGVKGIGSTVNLETDLIGKYVARFLLAGNMPATGKLEKQDISLSFLTDNGFI